MQNNSVLTNRISVEINYAALLEEFDIYKVKNQIYDKENKTKNDFVKFYTNLKRDFNFIGYGYARRYILLAIQKDRQLPEDVKNNYDVIRLHYVEIQKENCMAILRLLNSTLPLMASKDNFFDIREEPDDLFYLVKEAKHKALATVKIHISDKGLLTPKVVGFYQYNKNNPRQQEKAKYIKHQNRLVKASSEDLKDEKNTFYTKGGMYGRKTELKFFNLMSNQKDFDEDKIKVLIRYLKSFKTHLGHIAKISFARMDIELYKNYNAKEEKDKKEELKKAIIELANQVKIINIVNYTIENEETIEKIQLLSDTLKAFSCKLEVKVSNKLIENGYNITLTYEKSFYEDNKKNKEKLQDPYKEIHENRDFLVQNITNTTNINETLVYVLLKELAIKKEIKDRKFILPYPKFKKETAIIYPHIKKRDKRVDKNTKEYAFCKAVFNGKKIYFDKPLQIDELIYCDEIVNSIDMQEELEAIIITDNGENINYIVKTDEIPLPEIDILQQKLCEYQKLKENQKMKPDEILDIWDSVYHKDGEYKNEKEREKRVKQREILIEELNKYRRAEDDTVLIANLSLNGKAKFATALEKHLGVNPSVSFKRKEDRDVLNGLLGIKYNKQEYKYYIGEFENLNTTISKASPIRQIRKYYGNNIMDEILPQLDVFSIKNKHFTVLPFGLKYVREYYLKYNSEL